jgi:hypothetical protein
LFAARVVNGTTASYRARGAAGGLRLDALVFRVRWQRRCDRAEPGGARRLGECSAGVSRFRRAGDVIALRVVYDGRVCWEHPRVQEVDGCTPLHMACRFGHREAAEVLIQHGADSNPVNLVGALPPRGARQQPRSPSGVLRCRAERHDAASLCVCVRPQGRRRGSDAARRRRSHAHKGVGKRSGVCARWMRCERVRSCLHPRREV